MNMKKNTLKTKIISAFILLSLISCKTSKKGGVNLQLNKYKVKKLDKKNTDNDSKTYQKSSNDEVYQPSMNEKKEDLVEDLDDENFEDVENKDEDIKDEDIKDEENKDEEIKDESSSSPPEETDNPSTSELSKEEQRSFNLQAKDYKFIKILFPEEIDGNIKLKMGILKNEKSNYDLSKILEFKFFIDDKPVKINLKQNKIKWVIKLVTANEEARVLNLICKEETGNSLIFGLDDDFLKKT